MIEVKENIFWNENSEAQSEEATNWLREEILPQMACNPTEIELTQPIYDKFKRPTQWTIETATCVVVIDRIYINENSPSWALDKDQITVTAKI